MCNRGYKFSNWLCFFVLILFVSSFFNFKVSALELDTEMIDMEDVDSVIFNDEAEINTDSEIFEEYDEVQAEKIVNDEMATIEMTKEEILTSYSIGMEFVNGVVTVEGNIREYITVKEILASINIEGLVNDYLIEKIGVIDVEGSWLEDYQYVGNTCSIIFISNEFVSSYKIKFLGDINSDNLVDESDVNTLVNNYLESSEDENIEAEEVSYVDAVLKNNTYLVEEPIIKDDLVVNLEVATNEEINVGKEVDVNLSIDGFENNYINTISGYIDYDNDILEIENIFVAVNGVVVGEFFNDKFIYVLDNYSKNDTILIIRFRCLKSGYANVYVDKLKLIMNGYLLNVGNNTNLGINVLEYGKGGDGGIEIIGRPSNNVQVESVTSGANKINSSISFVNKASSIQNENVKGVSSDNYIKDLKITDYEILFNKDINYYLLDVDADVYSLDLNIILNDEKATYSVLGNDQFKTGKNKIIITVSALDGTNREYVIEVNKKEKKSKVDNTMKEEITKVGNAKESKKEKYHLILIITMIVIIVILIYKLLRLED